MTEPGQIPSPFENATKNGKSNGHFWRFSAAGISFQGGAASVEANTIISAMVQGLTGSPFAVGAAAAINLYGWLFPQIIVAYLAQRRERRMGFYAFGAYGRAIALLLIAALLWLGADLPAKVMIGLFFLLWVVYGFISGVVGVPYNDIVARSIPSSRRSRLLAVRFFGGGILALAVAGLAHELLEQFSFHVGYALILLIGGVTLAASATFFVSAKEPVAPLPPKPPANFKLFLAEGIAVLKRDRRFRVFLYVQGLAGVVSMALPFYILQVAPGEKVIPFVGIFLGAQTGGALVSNTLWGWWGDRRGKLSLLRLVSALNAVAPTAMLIWIGVGGQGSAWTLPFFAVVFFILGAVGNGRAIAYLGYLMEISPNDRRPAYSGYFNALVAPAALLPMLGAAIGAISSFSVVFAICLAAALAQVATLRLLDGGSNRRPRSWLAWQLARLRYRRAGLHLDGQPDEEIWYFAFGANMNDESFQDRRGMRPTDWRPGRVVGYRLRFNLEGRPIGKAAPANISPDPNAEVWGVLYKITRADLVYLDRTEGVPGNRYKYLWLEAIDLTGNSIDAVTYVAEGKAEDGYPSLRYITLLRDGAKAHNLPSHWLEKLKDVRHAQ